jgi:anti-anti-sigma regulatory factor
MAPVLRITRVNPGQTPAILKLEGRLAGPWVQELERVVALSADPATRVVLHMADVTYADAAGATLLDRLVGDLADVGSVSSFVAALLERKSDDCA